MKTKFIAFLGLIAVSGLLIAATSVPANPGLIITRTAVTAAYTNSYSDYFVACSGTNFTVTLPAIADGRVGCTFRIGATGTNTVTLAPHSGDTIAGSSSPISISTHTSVTITSDGVSDWEK